MPPPPQSPSHLSDPPALLAIARAAHLIGDRDLERAARRILRERYGVEVSFRRPTDQERKVPDENR
jgi:hypothetical protein